MEFGLSEQQTLLADSVRRYLADAVDLDTVRGYADGGDDAAIWSGLVDLGVAGLLVPESAGGLELGALDAVVVAECLGAAVAPGPFLGTAVLAPTAIRAAGRADEAPFAELLAAIATGGARVGVAVSEAVGARAGAGVRAHDGALSGRALFALDADADHWIVADGERGLHLVAADAERLTRTPLATVDRTRRTVELVLENTPATPLSTDPAVCAAVVRTARVMLAADTLGAARHMLVAAVAYAGEREQFGRPIATFQAVKHLCAEMAAELEPCVSLVWYAGHALDAEPEEAPLVACHAKALLGDVGRFVAKTSTEVHGGMGFTDLLGLHYWFKRIDWNRQMLGTPVLVREEAARLQGLVA
jgi:alkylation response protein AidB-like acyl-CoA dehydrogenase